MISFLPDQSVRLPEGQIRFVANDNGEYAGSCTFAVEGDRAFILALEADRLSLVSQGLIRAVLSAAAGRGAYIAQVSPQTPGEIFEEMGFTNKNGILTAEIPDVLLGGCAGDRQEM